MWKRMMSFGKNETYIRNANDNISLLKGCGKATTNKLNAHGIYTYQSLIRFKGDIPNINLKQLQTVAIKELNNSKEIDAHNWKDRVCHVVRAKGHVTRAVIENLVIGPHKVMLSVKWKDKGKTCRKQVTPISLLCTQIMWLSNDIMSDDSDSDSCDPIEHMLPKFLIDVKNTSVLTLTQFELQGIQSVVKETNQLYNCVYPSSSTN